MFPQIKISQKELLSLEICSPKNFFQQQKISEKKNFFSHTGWISLQIKENLYGRTCLDVYLTKKLWIFPLLYVHIGDNSTTVEVFWWFHLNLIGRSKSWDAKIRSKNLCIHSAIKFKLFQILNWQFFLCNIS